MSSGSVDGGAPGRVEGSEFVCAGRGFALGGVWGGRRTRSEGTVYLSILLATVLYVCGALNMAWLIM